MHGCIGAPGERNAKSPETFQVCVCQNVQRRQITQRRENTATPGSRGIEQLAAQAIGMQEGGVGIQGEIVVLSSTTDTHGSFDMGTNKIHTHI